MSKYCFCGAESNVVDSRFGTNERIGAFIRRRRKCLNGHRFTTYEIENAMIDAFVEQVVGIGRVRAALVDLFDMREIRQPEKRLSNPLNEKQGRPRKITHAITQNKRACEKCGKLFTARNPTAKFCSPGCRQTAFMRSRRKAIAVPEAA